MTEKRGSPDYRRAAEAALGQLEWCIDYLHRIRKDTVARRLSRNRDSIARAMRGQGRSGA